MSFLNFVEKYVGFKRKKKKKVNVIIICLTMPECAYINRIMRMHALHKVLNIREYG